ncbi:IS1634 family transposase [Agrococcus sp. KRD186]|uniref:IS1634 family transposase n=1 Tax=Agrococcus sp. KRD186 TaxID=2729730 RepID=UPI0019D15FA7|nr:IS1634 family transposase [Agrococcus sp. KRD186]
MYLRETRRKNRDGSVVRYFQLAHNVRHPETGAPTAKVIHNFGRAEDVDRDALARLVSSISRMLGPEQAEPGSVPAAAGEAEVIESRRMGGAWTLDRLWERLGIGAAIRAAAEGRKLDADAVERVIFALVAQRALEPASKLAATRWVAERVWIEDLAALSDDQAYRGMDFLLEALEEIAAEVFRSVATLLNLDLDIVFVDTTSTYFETERPDELPELAEPTADEGGNPAESGARTFGHSKDFRTDLPQVVIAMAVTRDGVPVKCWTFPGNTADTAIIRTIKDDLAGWHLHRMVWVADRGFASATNRAYLTRGGGHYIHAEKLRHTNAEAAAALARPGRYKTVAGNLRVKEVHVAPGGKGDGDGGARAQRFVICHNPDQATRDVEVRANLVAHLQSLIDGSDAWTARKRDELVGSLKGKPGLRRYLRRTGAGLLRIDKRAIEREAHLDGKWLLRTSDATLSPEDLAAAYKQLLAVERGWRDMKGHLGLRPVFHHREDRIRGHVQLCWLSLLLIRVIENTTGDTWRNIRHELDRMHLVTLASADGGIAQRTALTDGQRAILAALELPEPHRFQHYTPAN